MRIGIMADTHNQVARVRQAVALLAAEGVERLFHCGDLTDPEIVHACAQISAVFVRGNNDHRWPAIHDAILRCGGLDLEHGGEVTLSQRRIAITHGHDASMMRKLLAGEPDYLFLGHSHREVDRREGPTRIINPGALHRAAQYTVAILELTTDRLRLVPIPHAGSGG